MRLFNKERCLSAFFGAEASKKKRLQKAERRSAMLLKRNDLNQSAFKKRFKGILCS